MQVEPFHTPRQEVMDDMRWRLRVTGPHHFVKLGCPAAGPAPGRQPLYADVTLSLAWVAVAIWNILF